MRRHLELNTRVLLVPRRAGLIAGADNTVDVLVRIQAPDGPPEGSTSRPLKALALVIDRSGSMSGRPLDEAKRCAHWVVSRLRGGDQASIVQFDHEVQRVLPCTMVADGRAHARAIEAIEDRGNTDLHGGWADGAASLGEAMRATVRRVILLSDGQANAGITDVEEIARQCAEAAAHGITTSTYGLGHHFNEELMVAMARAGGGNHYYGETVDDLKEPFEQELELLFNVCLMGVTLQVSCPDGVRVEMLNSHPRLPDGGWQLPDLAWGSEASALMRLHVPAAHVSELGKRISLLQVTVTGTVSSGEVAMPERTSLALAAMSREAWEALPEDALVVQREAEVQAAAMLERTRAAALAADWKAVDGILEEASEKLCAVEWVGDVLASIKEIAHTRQQQMIAKEAMYSSGKLGRRLAAKQEAGTPLVGDEVPAFLRRKPLQGKDGR